MSPLEFPPRPTQVAHQLLRGRIQPGDLVADATAGNGHDTAFLASLVGPTGNVLAFDVQEQAIISTRDLLTRAGLLERVSLLHESHANLASHVKTASLAAVMFNLGWLPGEDHHHITTAEETLRALGASADCLKSGGVLTVVCYPGHPGGAEEAEQVESWMTSLADRGWRVAKYGMLGTRRPAPFLLAAHKP